MLDKGLFRTTILSIVIFWLIAFALIPHLLVLIAGFLERSDVDFVKFIFTFENYARTFSSRYFHVFYNSLVVAMIVTACCLLIGYPCAYIVSRCTQFSRNFLMLLLIIPFWTSSLVRTYSLMVILKANGLVNYLLIWAGIIEAPLELLYTRFAVIIGLVYSLLPFMILPIYSVLEKFDDRYSEAARDLGANMFNLFFRIILPISMPGIISGCMLVFLPALSMFYVPDLLGGARDMLFGNLIKNQFMVAHDWPFGAALSMIFTIIIAIMLLAHFRSSRSSNREIEL